MLNILKITKYSNSFIIESEKYVDLIDTTFEKKPKELIEKVKEIGKPLRYIFITHSHIDHIIGLYEIKKNFPEAKIVAHKNAKDYISGKVFRYPKGYKGFLLRFLTPFLGYKGLEVDIEVKEGKFNEYTIIETFGHTNDSISILIDKNIFVGDLITNEKNKLSLSPKEFNENEEEIKKSIEKILKYDFENIYFGHGNEILGNSKEKIKDFYQTLNNY